jgi:hypothetical protein
MTDQAPGSTPSTHELSPGPKRSPNKHLLVLAALRKTIAVLWASPNTGLGVTVGLIGLGTGGRVQFRDGCLEFWGGGVAWLLRRFPVRPVAMCLGHVVLGLDAAYLRRCGRHERVHVRQYERWGPLFLPAYGLASLFVWWRGGRAYRDNPFEVEAYNEAG